MCVCNFSGIVIVRCIHPCVPSQASLNSVLGMRARMVSHSGSVRRALPTQDQNHVRSRAELTHLHIKTSVYVPLNCLNNYRIFSKRDGNHRNRLNEGHSLRAEESRVEPGPDSWLLSAAAKAKLNDSSNK